MTDVFFTPAAPRWSTYIAIGDSFTEGLMDEPGDPGTFRGWADLLAQSLTARRTEAGRAPLQYANLAVRGSLLGPILSDQLPRALASGPDLLSLIGGGNDLLRPGGDPDRLAARLDRAVRSARDAGVDVLLGTGMDTRRAGRLLAVMRPKVAILNAHIWSIARSHGAYVLDVWGLRALQDRRMWAEDRIHMNSLGHQRTAQAALVALGLPPDDDDWTRALIPAPRTSRVATVRDNAAWLRRDVLPWAGRRLRRTSSGAARVAKRPDLTTLPIETEPDRSAPAQPGD